MPYIPKKKMVKRAPKKAYRRRLQPAITPAILAGGATLLRRGYKRLSTARKASTEAKFNRAKRAAQNRISQSDNITTAKAVVVGKQKTISFQEKVSRTIRPPLVFKRNYAFSAECVSGRKAMFSMRFNTMDNNDLNSDLQSFKSSMTSDTPTADTTITGNSRGDNAQFYVDKLIEKIQMVNSSSNSITGYIHLFAYKRDSGNTYGDTQAILDPVNMLMYYSTQALSTVTNGAGAENIPGNGWAFDAGTGGNSGRNWGAQHNMPGSSINPTGACGVFDPALGFSTPQVKDGINFWFRKVGKSSSFSLKPGQQFNSSFIFNDLPILNREEQAQYIYISGVTYVAVVEFKSGIVGSTESSDISTGTCQLSVIRENQRILGLKNTLRSKTVLQTSPLAQIAIASQVIINSDTGVGLSGTVIDS